MTYDPIPFTDPRWTQYMTLPAPQVPPTEHQMLAGPPATEPNGSVRPPDAPCPAPCPRARIAGRPTYAIPRHESDGLFWALFVGFHGDSGIDQYLQCKQSARTGIMLRTEVLASTDLPVKKVKAQTGRTFTNDQYQSARTAIHLQKPATPAHLALYAIHYSATLWTINLDKRTHCVLPHSPDTGATIVLYLSKNQWIADVDPTTVDLDAVRADFVYTEHTISGAETLLSVSKYTKPTLLALFRRLLQPGVRTLCSHPVPETEAETWPKRVLYDHINAYLQS